MKIPHRLALAVAALLPARPDKVDVHLPGRQGESDADFGRDLRRDRRRCNGFWSAATTADDNYANTHYYENTLTH